MKSNLNQQNDRHIIDYPRQISCKYCVEDMFALMEMAQINNFYDTLESQCERTAHQSIRSVSVHTTETAINYSLLRLKPTQAFTQNITETEQVKKDSTTPVTNVVIKQIEKKTLHNSNSVMSKRKIKYNIKTIRA